MQEIQARNAQLYMGSVASPIGDCTLLATEQGICWTSTPGADKMNGLLWAKRQLHIEQVSDSQDIPVSLQYAMKELSRYFAGERVTFSCALDMHGTPFQIAVWKALLDIPYGETRSYGEIASMLGRPTASRAVGAANGANPIAIIVPCHRVIGSNGTLTGYGGGLASKEWLLRLENVHL